ncbi:ankyrin repeat and LEM domain-containing protein 2 homolog [Culex pipiens pallens]|uniref:ankyrin repeat and LEM domain-containing protein 2 homolog n=1 Tax=Culex pipiens pallens TaxID=42434 RepID=UPI0022AA3275|nr:ankyrin repeat and LEM domain-containing protein 2 homolog [Culex pipiens pallens]
MEYYAIYLPYKEPDVSIKSFYTDKEEALKMLKTHKEARLKAFRTSEEAVYFYLNGPTEPTTTTTASSSLVMGTTSEKASLTTGNGNNLLGGQMPKSPTTGQLPLPSASAKLKLEKTPFKAPKSQELVAFRKNIEKNELDLVRNIIELNPRYLVSSGDMPTILKEGPRYNALHVAAMEGNTDMCRLILATIENPAFIEFLHGQRNASTDEVSAILLDLYLNMPDKCRSETPLHFAAKFGSVGVIEVLISYPQCKLTKNSDGHLPKDIICARAKPRNDTPEIRRAIADLLRERFYVPVLRAVDRSTPPVIGEPFTLANPPNLEPARGGAGDRFSPQLEIKAYAGPMDREQAQVFCRRWKTPPRLIPSPRAGFVSPVRGVSSSSKIPVAASTPIATKGAPAGGRRTLFPNKSFELALEGEREKEKEKEEELNNSINNNFEIEVVREEEEEEEEALEEDVKNGNSVVRAVKSSVASSFLFRKYREPPLQNSFATIYDDDDEEDEFRKDLGPSQIPVPVTPVKDSPQINGNGSFSYFCDGNNSFYEGTNITESPSFKERRLRLTDTEKGLEIIGRNLAEDHAVGWNEYWAFLGTFADLRNNEGLAKLEDFLKKRREKVELDEQEEALKNVRKEQLPSTGPNDSLGSICDALDQMRLHTGATPQLPNFRKRPTPLTSLPAVPLFPADPPPQEPPQIRSNITNPYLCLHRSLQVFAKRFVKNLDDACSSTMTVDFNAFFQQAVVDCVRKLNTLVGNYRRDAAFTTIDFSRVHSRYAQLIVLHIESTPETAPKIIHRLKLLLDRSRDVNAAHRHPDLAESLACLQNLLDLYILKSAELAGAGADDPETEASCSAAWREHPLVRGCRCRIEAAGGYAKKGSMERLVKRREQRRKVTAAVPVAMEKSSSFSLYRDPAGQDVRKVVSTPVAVAKAVAGRTWSDEEEDDEDEEYFSCSDSELDTDSDVEDDDPNVSYVTPPSSPSSFLLQSPSPLADSKLQQESNNSSGGTSRVSTDDGVASGGGDDEDDQDQFLDTVGDDDDEDDGVEREPEFRNYIEGAAPTKQDVDVLNVVEKRPVDAAEFPHVHEWRQAMLRMSPEERERIATQKKPRDLSRSNWRGAANANDTSMNLADLSANQSSFLLLDQPPPSSPKPSQLTTTPPSSPIRSVSAAAGMFRFGRARELAANTAANDSLGSLDGRLGLMNISDCGVDTPKEGHRHRHQLIQQQQQQRVAPAPSS